MKYPWHWFLPICLFVPGCSDSNEPEDTADRSGGRVWQVQEDAYRKAQEMAPMLEEAERRRRDILQQQGG